jgi:hypothetical protein
MHAPTFYFTSGVAPPDPFEAALAGRLLYHATPLHYLPSILDSGKLLSASSGICTGLTPRRTASRRDKMLGVHHFVHFALTLQTPILKHKLAKGMPHCVLVFNAHSLDQTSECETAILPFNTKAWLSRADASPVSDRTQMACILDAHDRLSRYPSIEYLVRDFADLTSMREILLFCQRDFDLAAKVIETFSRALMPKLVLTLIPGYDCSKPIAETQSYLDYCSLMKGVLPIPRIEFD